LTKRLPVVGLALLDIGGVEPFTMFGSAPRQIGEAQRQVQTRTRLACKWIVWTLCFGKIPIAHALADRRKAHRIATAFDAASPFKLEHIFVRSTQ